MGWDATGQVGQCVMQDKGSGQREKLQRGVSRQDRGH